MPDQTNVLIASRELPWGHWLTILLIVMCLAFLALGLRGLLDPQGASAMLGVNVQNPLDLALMQAVGARNIGIVALAFTLLVTDSRKAIGYLLISTALIACLDFIIILRASGLTTAIKHIAYVVVLFAVGMVALRTSAS